MNELNGRENKMQEHHRKSLLSPNPNSTNPIQSPNRAQAARIPLTITMIDYVPMVLVGLGRVRR